MYNLLFVDDNVVFFRQIQRMSFFKAADRKFNIAHYAANGIEALKLLRENDVDVVLTDIRMPMMNGLELLKEIRNGNLCKCTILFSEFSEFSYAKEGIVNGAFDYIVKPLTDEKLQQCFFRVLNQLESFPDYRNLFDKAVDDLCAYLTGKQGDPQLHLDRILTLMKSLDVSLAEKLNLISKGLTRICRFLENARPYLSLYISLEDICKLDCDVQDDEKLAEVFSCKVQYLMEQINEFKLVADSSMIRDICEYVFAHIDERCKQSDVANIFYVNKRYLCTLFHKKTGQHYAEFVNQFKIKRAVYLLQKGYGVTEVSNLLSFCDVAYFSNLFKKQTGTSPSKYLL